MRLEKHMNKLAKVYLFCSGVLSLLLVITMFVSWLTGNDYAKFYGLFDSVTDMILSGMVLVMWTNDKGEE